MRLWEEGDHTGTWYHPLHIATSVYWLDCVQICKDARLTMQSAAKLKYCTSIVMRLIHELHVLELQIEMNMYDRRSFSACNKREFFRPFSLRSYTFSKYCALHGKNLSTLQNTYYTPLTSKFLLKYDMQNSSLTWRGNLVESLPTRWRLSPKKTRWGYRCHSVRFRGCTKLISG